MLEGLFLQLLNMSFTGAVVIVFVLLARVVLQKAPKIFSYALWSVVLFRLICPVSFESALSLLPTKPSPIPRDIVYQLTPEIDTGVSAINNSVNGLLPPATPYASINPLQIWVWLGSLLWVLGIALLLVHSLVALLRLRARLRSATPLGDNVFSSDALETALVLGLFRPRIYLPASLGDTERGYILLHEQTHIKRFDHVVRLLSFLALCLHWFNPLVWLAFFLSGQDMERACDEAVIRRLGGGVKKAYSASLLTLSTGRRLVAGTPLAFGEGNTRSRIKNVLAFRAPAGWLVVVSLLLVATLTLGFAANRRPNRSFPLPGAALTDLQPEEMSASARSITGAYGNSIIVPMGNFPLMVSPAFQWVDSPAISFLFSDAPGRDGPYYSAQLRLFPDEGQCFITNPTAAPLPASNIPLQTYLEALKYLPQAQIQALSGDRPDQYIIQLAEGNAVGSSDRCIYYTRQGVTEAANWVLCLVVSPLYATDDGAYHGLGADVLYLFYQM